MGHEMGELEAEEMHFNGPLGCRTKIDWGRGGRRETTMKATAVAQGEGRWPPEPHWQLGGGEVCVWGVWRWRWVRCWSTLSYLFRKMAQTASLVETDGLQRLPLG